MALVGSVRWHARLSVMPEASMAFSSRVLTPIENVRDYVEWPVGSRAGGAPEACVGERCAAALIGHAQ